MLFALIVLKALAYVGIIMILHIVDPRLLIVFILFQLVSILDSVYSLYKQQQRAKELAKLVQKLGMKEEAPGIFVSDPNKKKDRASVSDLYPDSHKSIEKKDDNN